MRATPTLDVSRSSSRPMSSNVNATWVKPDMTLKELREALGLDCSLPAIHYALSDMDLTYKKRHSAPVSRTCRISRRRARGGAAAN